MKTMKLNNYKIELETNQRKIRAGIMINNQINYERKISLELGKKDPKIFTRASLNDLNQF